MKARVGLALAVAVGVLAVPALADEEDARITAFRATCIPDRQDFDATAKRAEAEGWQPTPADSHPELKSVIASTSGDSDPDTTSTLQSYRKDIAGRHDYLLVTEITAGDVALVGCYLYDFDAASPLGVDPFNYWLGDSPAGVVEEPNNAFGYKWDEPPKLPGVWEVYATFLFEGGAAAKDIGFSGQVIKITSVAAKKK